MTIMTPNTVARTSTEAVDFDDLVREARVQRVMRIAEAVARGPLARHVLVVGHPFVDVWQAVRPQRLGLAEWPVIDRGTEWKHGICSALGWPHGSQADIARAWQRILARVDSFADLEPAFLGRVEELIDFVTAPASGG
jgi:hypothetical protein